MAIANSTLSESAVRSLVSQLRFAWLTLSEVELVFELRDQVSQDRNPTMTNTVRMVLEQMDIGLERLERGLGGGS